MNIAYEKSITGTGEQWPLFSKFIVSVAQTQNNNRKFCYVPTNFTGTYVIRLSWEMAYFEGQVQGYISYADFCLGDAGNSSLGLLEIA